jgi:hypothetical protein
MLVTETSHENTKLRHGGTKLRHGSSHKQDRQVDGDVYEEYEQLLSRDWTAAQIHKELDNREEFKDRVPRLRTIQRWVRQDRTPRDPSAPWLLATEPDPYAAQHVLEVLAWVVEYSNGTLTYITEREAEWITHIRRAVPDLPAHELWRLIRLYYIPYQMQMEDKETTAEQRDALNDAIQRIDKYLAFLGQDDGPLKYEIFVDAPQRTRELEMKMREEQAERDREDSDNG